MDPMDPMDPMDEYLCGIGPGAPGNEKGVGKYCDGFADCPTTECRSSPE